MADHDIATAPETAPTTSLGTLGSQDVREFIRYFSASVIALVVDVGVLAVLTSLFGVPYLVSGAIAFLLGLIAVYLLSVFWVFEHRVVHNRVTEFILFATVGLIGLVINEHVLWLLTGVFGLFYLLSKIGSAFIVFSWNFLARKYLLFRTDH